MNVWNQAPLVRLLLPFLAGIISAVYLPIHYSTLLLVLLVLVVIIASIVLIPKFTISYKKSWWFGLLLYLTLFGLGYQLTLFKTERFNPNHFSNHVDDSSIVRARLIEPFVEKEKSLKVIVEVCAVKKERTWQKVIGHCMVYIQKDPTALSLKYGDELYFKTKFKEIPSVQNPGEFNYKRFLAFHSVYQQVYLKSSHWQFTGSNSGNWIYATAINLRDKLLKVLTENKVQGDEYSVGAALLLGYEDKLDGDIISAYSSTGALHVLSVSGLHVAIIYVVFNWCLFFLDKIKHGPIIKAIVLILMLWFYSAITGLSPSVLRASTMFSFIIVAQSFKRYTNIYNTLAASAFLLLIIDPYIIMQVGFQLSYLAVIGIVYLQPKIQEWFSFDNWLLNQIWTITAVSIAAQVATFPLGLLYFHQFPNYFLLSNLLVIPISTIIIYLGIAVFTFAKVSIIVSYLALGFSWSVWLLNASVKWIEQLPFSLLQGISISIIETWLLYGLIILFVFYLTNRKYTYLMYAFVALILVLVSQVYEQHQQFHQKKIVVYNIPKTSAIDFVSAKSNVLLTDTTFAKNESRLLFHVKHNWWDLGADKNQIVSSSFNNEVLKINQNWIQFYDKKMVVINNKTAIGDPLGKPIDIDYLLISYNPKLTLKQLLEFFNCKQLIFDSSNSEYKIAEWKKECLALNQAFFAVSESGAFELEL